MTLRATRRLICFQANWKTFRELEILQYKQTILERRKDIRYNIKSKMWHFMYLRYKIPFVLLSDFAPLYFGLFDLVPGLFLETFLWSCWIVLFCLILIFVWKSQFRNKSSKSLNNSNENVFSSPQFHYKSLIKNS